MQDHGRLDRPSRGRAVRGLSLAVVALLAAGACSDDPAAPSTTAPTSTTAVSTTVPSPSTTAPTSTTSTTAPTSTTSTTSPPVPAGKLAPDQAGPPPVEVIVASRDGAFAITGDDVTRLVEGPVALAVDDLGGGLVFQVVAGRIGAYENTGPATRVWWVPRNGGSAQELLVPADDQALSLHDVVTLDGRVTVFYTRASGSTPEDLRDRLRRFDLERREVTDLGVIAGWESGALPSIGGELVSLSWVAEGFQGVDFISARDGARLDIAANPAPPEMELECCHGPSGVDLDPDGIRFAYVEFLEDDRGFFVAPDLVVVDVASGNELFRATLDRPDQGWYPESLDLAGDYVIVNRYASGSFDDVDNLVAAWIIELPTGRVWESPVAGRARLLRAVPAITPVVPSP